MGGLSNDGRQIVLLPSASLHSAMKNLFGRPFFQPPAKQCFPKKDLSLMPPHVYIFSTAKQGEEFTKKWSSKNFDTSDLVVYPKADGAESGLENRILINDPENQGSDESDDGESTREKQMAMETAETEKKTEDGSE